MKYYMATIEEYNGEFEYETRIVLKASDEDMADRQHEYHVGNWYGEDRMTWSDSDNGYWNDYVLVKEGSIFEIAEFTFNELKKCYVSDLTVENLQHFTDWHMDQKHLPDLTVKQHAMIAITCKEQTNG